MEKYRVTAFQLNVRKTPDKDTLNNIVGVLNKNDVVEVTKHSEDEYWYFLKKGKLKGWSSNKFLQKVMDKYMVTAHRLNIREEPGFTGGIVGALDKGEIVNVTGISPDKYWYNIQKDDLIGWSSHKYLRKLFEGAEEEEFPWMAIAESQKGVKEFPGNGDNPIIVGYLKSTTMGYPENENDETAWCSAFVNWCLEQAGFAGTDSAAAQSWLKWGKRADPPRRGCIVVFWRENPNSWKGHVGFFIKEDHGRIHVLGGNQSNSVNIITYSKDRVLSYRELT